MIRASALPVTWHKSSYSTNGGNCIEIGSALPVTWRKSSYSTNGGDCVEIGKGVPSLVPVRDSKTPDGRALVFPADGWSSFVTAVQCGELPAA
jgi:hypothetical protein